MQQREEVSMETAWLSSLGRIAQRMKRIAAAGLAPGRFWIRFYGGDADVEDSRPIRVPCPFPWWETGTLGDGRAVICTLVEAPNPATAKARVRSFWPEAEINSCIRRPAGWKPPEERFPTDAES
jgi:hypothetical protein